jgi:hypothetical protein
MEENNLNPNDWEILTDTGWKSFSGVIKNKNIRSVKLKFDDGTELICSENHELLTYSGNFTYASKSRYKKIVSDSAYKKVISVIKNGFIDAYDVTNVDGGRYFTNGVVSHNCHILNEFWASVYPIISSSMKSKVIMASTPRDTSGLFYKLYSQSIKGENNWVSMKVLWNEVPGRTEKWAKETMSSLGDASIWRREYECEFDEVGESALDKDLFDQMKKHTIEATYLMDDGKYSLWEKPSDEKIYVAGVDIAEGVGKDATVVQILDITDPKRIKQVAVYHNNKITPTEFTPKLREILQHWGDPIAMIERNNCGAQVVDNLKKDFNYENIVNWGVDRVANRTSNKLGIIAHTNTKYHGVMNQRYWVNIEKRVQINDIGTILELNDFVRSKAGTWSAKNGSHDDRVMSLIWALMVLHEDIAPVYFDIIEKDGNGKPIMIKSIDYGIKYFMNPLSIYGNEKNTLGADALPSFMGGGSQVENPDMDDLFNQGWRPY